MITPYAALAAFLALSFNKGCHDCAAPLALLTAFSLLFYMEHHAMFAVFISIDALIALYISKYKTCQSTVIMCLCLCSICANIYGFNLYYNYMDMGNYNLTMQCIIIMQVMMIWMLRDGGNLGLHILYDVFRVNNTNRN